MNKEKYLVFLVSGRQTPCITIGCLLWNEKGHKIIKKLLVHTIGTDGKLLQAVCRQEMMGKLTISKKVVGESKFQYSLMHS